jgi:hypothetical protein
MSSFFDYLKLPEPTYISKYEPVDTRLLSEISGDISNQTLAAQDRVDSLDMVRAEILGKLGNLNETQRTQMSSELDEIRGNLDTFIDQNGVRGSRQMASRAARDFVARAQPYQQRAQQLQSVSERLEKIGSRDARRFLQSMVHSANEDTPITEQMELSSYIDIGDNWIDYADFAEKRKKLLTTRGASNVSFDAQGNPVLNEIQLPNGVRAVLETKGRTANETTSFLVSDALTDSQMRAQLELEAKALAFGGNPVFAQMIDEDGNFDPTKKVFVKFDSEGDVDSRSQALTGIELMALNKFGEMGNAMSDFSAQIKYEEALNGGADNIGLRTLTQIDVAGQNITSEQWYVNQIEQLKTINTNLDTERLVLAETLGVTITADGDNISVNVDGRSIPLSQYMNTLGTAERGQAQNFIEMHRAGRIKVQQIERSKENHLDRLREQLLRNTETELFADAITFNEKTGKFDFGDSVTQILADNPSLIEVKWRSRVYEDIIPSGVVASLGENGITQTRLMVSGLGGYGLSGTVEDVSTIIKRDGKFYDITNNNLIKQVYSVIDNENKAFSEELSQRRDVAGVIFDSQKDRNVIQNFMTNGIRLQGATTDINGKMIQGIYGMRPQAVTLVEGVPTVIGIALDAEGNPVEGGQNARFTGSEATTIAYNMLGNDYFGLLGTNSIAQLLPQSTASGSNKVKISPRDISNLFGNEGKLANQDVEIEQVNTVNGGQRIRRYNILINGTRMNQTNFSFPSQIYAYLLELNTEN